MRYETFVALRDINRLWPFESGKIIQLLLAISLDNRRGGYSVTNRLSEGVDLEIVRGVKKFAVEVKTTEGRYVTLGEKDISGLRNKSLVDGYTPALAALQIQKSSDWVIADATKFRPGDYTPSRLALDPIAELESAASTYFERTVTELIDVLRSPRGGLPLNFLSSLLANESD